MKIKVKLTNPSCKLIIFEKGEWIDLKTSKTEAFAAPTMNKQKEIIFDSRLIDLGVAMELPKYFEANVLPRSSTFKHHGLILANSEGVIDSTYKGNDDVWKFNAIALRSCVIPEGTRIAQFRIRPGQFAPWWVKLKWLFTSKIKFVYVKELTNPSRGGHGSTGVK